MIRPFFLPAIDSFFTTEMTVFQTNIIVRHFRSAIMHLKLSSAEIQCVNANSQFDNNA